MISLIMPPISVEKLDALKKKLSEFPPFEDKQRIVSKREAVAALAGQIDAMRQRGYPMERIVELLRSDGIELSVPTLRSYLREAKSQPAATPQSKAARKSRAKATTTS